MMILCISYTGRTACVLDYLKLNSPFQIQYTTLHLTVGHACNSVQHNPEKLTTAHMVKKFSAVYRSRKFITMHKTALH